VTAHSTSDRVESLLGDGGGILRLQPAWVARDFLPPGRRLGLPEVGAGDPYDVGERGAICERWLASTTPADNRVRVPDEGLSPVDTDDGKPLLLADAVRAAPDLVLGRDYAAAHPAVSAGCPSSSTTGPGCPSTSTLHRRTRPWSADGRRTRRTTSCPTSTSAHTRRRSSASTRTSRPGRGRRPCCRTCRTGTPT
jgi:hypothetical protein